MTPRDDAGGPSRREFVRHGVAALVLGRPLFGTLDRHPTVMIAVPPLVLETPAQYKAKAAELDAAVLRLGSLVSARPTSTAEIERLNADVSLAATKLDLHHAWMVSIALADGSLATQVRAAIRDSATLRRFVDYAKLDAATIDQFADATRRIRTRIDELNETTRAIADLIQQLLEMVAKLERTNEAILTTLPRIKKQLTQDRGCQQRWALCAAVLVSASSANPALGSAVSAAAAELAAAYRNTGADLAETQREAASQRFQQCITTAAALPPAQRAKAIAACQAQSLRDKGTFFT